MNKKKLTAQEKKNIYNKQWQKDNLEHRKMYLRQWRLLNQDKVEKYNETQRRKVEEQQPDVEGVDDNQ